MSGTSIPTNIFGGSGPINYGMITGGLGQIGGAAADIGQSIQAGYTAQGDLIAAQGFEKAGQIADQNAFEAQAAGKLQQVQLARQVYQTVGAGEAAAGANGLRLEGSVANLIRSTGSQGALASQLLNTQTQINVNGYLQQAQADYTEEAQANEAAEAAKKAASGSILGSVIKGVIGLASVVAAPFTGGSSLVLAAGLESGLSAGGVTK